MKPSRLAVASLVVFGVAAGCGGRSGLRIADGGARPADARAGDGGLIGQGGSGGSAGTGGTAGRDAAVDGPGPGGSGGTDAGPGRDGSVDTGPATLTGLGVTPALATAGVNTTVTFRATGRFSDGSTRDLSGLAAWSSSTPMVASVSGGVATTRGAGMAIITATSGGFSGRASLLVTAATLTELVISPPDLTVPVGMRATFTATGVYSDGSRQDLTGQASWSSTDTGIASVSGGVVTGLRAGTAGVLATFQNAAGKASVTVTSARLTALQLSPTAPVLSVPGNQQFIATAIFSDGTRGDVTAQATWQSSNDGVVSFAMGSPGQAFAIGPGATVVTASLGGLSASTMVLVTPARLTSIRVTPASVSLPVRTTQAFTATGGYSDGRTADLTSQVAWSSSDERVAIVSNAPGSQGVATALSAGGTAITASLSGVTGAVRLFVTEATAVSLSVTPKMVSVGVSAVQQLTATATFSDGSTRDVTDTTVWTSGDPAIAAVSNSPGTAGQLTGRTPGATAVAASYAGLGDKIPVTVTSAVLTSITIDPGMLGLVAGQRGDLTATGRYSDGTTLDVTAQATWTSDDASVATVSNAPGSSGAVTALVAGRTTVRAQLGDQQGIAVVIVTAATGQQLSVAPVAASARVGQQVQFTASLIRSNGTSMNVTFMAAWSSSDPMVASLGGMGPGGPSRATCRSPGTTTITATYMNLVDSTVLSCTPMRTLVDMQVTPFAVSLTVGQLVQFQATAIYDDGSVQNVTGQTTWASSNQMVADVSNQGGMGGRGQAVALSAGTATITGTYMGLSASGLVTVSAGMLIGLSVAPPALSLNVGETQPVQATALYSDGTSRNVTGMSIWASANQMVADVTNLGGRGQVTGLSDGMTTITAMYMGMSATSAVTVAAAKLIALQVTPINATLPKGTIQQYQATGIYSDNSSRNVTGQALWDSSTGAAAVSNAPGSRGQVTTLAPGTTQISASFGGLSGAATLTVTAATVTEVQVTPTNPTIPLAVVQPFQATAIYSDFTAQNVTGMATWTSSSPLVAQVSNAGGTRGQATGLSAGSTTISAAFMGTTGATTLTVTSATIKEIQVTPMTTSTPVGLRVSFNATAILSDNTSRDVTGMSTWTSSDDTVVAISNAGGTRGQATALKAGAATISATAGGVTGTASYTVGSQTLTSIAITPAMSTLAVGNTSSLVATGSYSDGSTFELTDDVTWISTMSGVATVSNAVPGRVTAVSAGSTTIQAHFQGKTGSASVTVTP